MRHQRNRHKLGRSKPHREATLASLSSALIQHKRITTTVAKAKALRPFIEPLITRAKEDTTHNRRQVFRHIRDKRAVSELFGDVADAVGNRPGGYTRVIRLGRRSGDGTELAMIELVDFNDVKPETGSSRKRTRRGGGRGRRRKKKETQQQAAPAPEAEEADTPEAVQAEPETADTPEAAAGEAAEAEAAKATTAEAAADTPEAAAEDPDTADDEKKDAS